METALEAIKERGAQSVIDLGCGEGNLLRLLMKDKTFTRVTDVDVSRSAMEHIRDKLKPDRLPEAQRQRLSLFQGSLTYRDKRFRAYDAAALVEVLRFFSRDPNKKTSDLLREINRQAALGMEFKKKSEDYDSDQLFSSGHKTMADVKKWIVEICGSLNRLNEDEKI
jgi:cyclopropane fatty-acyl-phospholipid synthase-like methyltransferase